MQYLLGKKKMQAITFAYYAILVQLGFAPIFSWSSTCLMIVSLSNKVNDVIRLGEDILNKCLLCKNQNENQLQLCYDYAMRQHHKWTLL